MKLNLNLTLSIIIAKGMTDDDVDNAALRVESLVKRFTAKYGHDILPSVQSSPNGVLDTNKAYLQAHGKARTPIVSDTELALRAKCSPTDWTNIQARREALLALGYDVFNLSRDKDYALAGDSGAVATVPAFSGEISTDEATE